MQAIYGYNMSTEQNIETTLSDFINSFEDMYHLYIYILSMFSAIRNTAEEIIELKRQRHLPTKEDLYPNYRFVNNILIHKIGENQSLQYYQREYKTGWDSDVELLFIRKIYAQLCQEDFFIEYMKHSSNAYISDKKLVLDILQHFMLDNEEMIHYFGDIKLNWQHDFNDAIVMAYYTLSSFKRNQSNTNPLPPIFKTSKDGVSNDFYFARELLEKTLKNDEEYTQIITDRILNWETERLATIDGILVKMAICEFREFPTIPFRVTFNEYIEISKYYSTPKSRYFINGLLDNILEMFKEENKINKEGRGLIE